MTRIERIHESAVLRDLTEDMDLRQHDRDHLNSLRLPDTDIVFMATLEDVPIAITSGRYLEWDSDFFEEQSYQVNIIDLSSNRRPSMYPVALIDSTLRELGQKGADFASSRVDGQDVYKIRSLEANGFRVYDISCVFASSRNPAHTSRSATSVEPMIRRSEERDLWDLITLSSNAFSFDRFHEDTRFGKERADALHGIWIRNLFYSEKTNVFVADLDGEIVGYVTYDFMQFSFDGIHMEDVLRIGLIAIDSHHSGKGIGSALVEYVKDISEEHGIRLVVGTQVYNAPAMRLYQSRGLHIAQSYVTLHKWLNEALY